MMVGLNPQLLKLPLLFAMARGIDAGFTSPQPVPSKDERDSASEKAREAVPDVGSWGPLTLKILAYSVEAYESYLIICKCYPEVQNARILSWLLPSPETFAHAVNVSATPTFIAGTTLVCLGAYLRSVCFRHLGRQFTFQLSIRKDHELVTDGPYSLVRHPSYSAALIQVIGFVLCLAGPGSWWLESSAWRSLVGKVITTIVAVQLTGCIYGGIDRTFKEDVMLKETFKEQWVEWARRVRYRMIPFIF